MHAERERPKPLPLLLCRALYAPDFLGVLAYRAVGGEDAALGDVDEAHAGELALVANLGVEAVVAVDVAREVGQEHILVAAVESRLLTRSA